MKQEYFILSLLIPDPKSLENDIDVFLQSLIEELIELWKVGVETYDASTKTTFQMHATIMWTINDFPAYGNLSGWCTYGRYACPPCNVDTHSRRLIHGKKFCYMSHRRFLDSTHKYRHDAKSFDGSKELGHKPLARSGSDLLDQLKEIRFGFGKMSKPADGVRKGTWGKRSIFFELPYWEHHLIKHNLDPMHIETNVCGNLVHALLNVDKKSKDNLGARCDLQEMKIRPELWAEKRGSKRTYLPPACFTMSPYEKNLFYEVLENVKFSEGYASNVSHCIHKNHKFFGLKSHDYHVLMQQLIPLAVRGTLPDKVSSVLIEFCSFFQGLYGKSLKVDELELFEEKIALILYEMEKKISPSFFTIMVHLVIYLASEAKIAGHVFYRWMYLIER
ncbi:hypothetical protein COCNU_10G006440 [Cocos nucifera]|uniref:DUF4218 domain-containing protein n=1 Tax=Cocos nucifera TaxID=13894 RepID=A0A8K0N7U0_COCNU|nr:hypothetical protein COCNU_10G006440 [Cocos nucifera]